MQTWQHPGVRFAYVINERASSITTLHHDAARGTLFSVATVSTLPDGANAEENTCVGIAASPGP
ncbi:beta-propeller fold lactonase family protein [Sorangium sp. So ce295]|uniref:beta-propeller fold lactonase family protein n=1 Tax=Sorangium sp. So ce295 TaxID=3133295 RepID=UPI003F623594